MCLSNHIQISLFVVVPHLVKTNQHIIVKRPTLLIAGTRHYRLEQLLIDSNIKRYTAKQVLTVCWLTFFLVLPNYSICPQKRKRKIISNFSLIDINRNISALTVCKNEHNESSQIQLIIVFELLYTNFHVCIVKHYQNDNHMVYLKDVGNKVVPWYSTTSKRIAFGILTQKCPGTQCLFGI